MNRPQRYLTRMVLFMMAILALALALIIPLRDAFLANQLLNGLILGVLVFGAIYIVRQVMALNPEIDWIENFKKAESAAVVAAPPKLLAPMAAMLSDTPGRLKLSTLSTRTLLDGIGMRLDEGREISRYMIGLLIFLGLLGTFWGLLATIKSIGGTIEELGIGGGDVALMFDNLKDGLRAPLDGMGTAFSSSLFGLAGSVILGFLDLQAGQAQNRFYMDLEDWLSEATHLTRGGGIAAEEGASTPAYLAALLEQSADSIDQLQRTVARAEDGRSDVGHAMMDLSERLARLTDVMQVQQDALLRMADGQIAVEAAINKLGGTRASAGGLDDAARGHLRNIDVHMKRLIDEQAKGRNAVTDEIRSEIKLLARTIAAVVDQQRSAVANDPGPTDPEPGGGRSTGDGA